MIRIQRQSIVPQSLALRRFDQIATSLFPEFSRNRIQQWIKSGQLLVDGLVLRPSDKLEGREVLMLNAESEPLDVAPEPMDIDVVYEDAAILIINKPAGLVVHPGAGNWSGTLLNGLLAKEPNLAAIPRGGIVHRLDKGTTGLMVVARTLEAQASLVDQLQRRSMKRVYEAVVVGRPEQRGTVNAPIGRHPQVRTRMAVRPEGVQGAKAAITHFTVNAWFDRHSHLTVSLETGRTHQIRVHMRHLGFPLLGDSTYGAPVILPQGLGRAEQQLLADFDRPALHARRLTLDHPITGETMSWQTPIPKDFAELLCALGGV